jgi:uncharacterized RDD family membrane protein YckC
MQCAECQTFFASEMEACPHCQTAVRDQLLNDTMHEDNSSYSAADRSSTASSRLSTLIEFPRAGRGPRPQWRKDLSERVREIQERRAREAAREAEEAARREAAQQESAAPLGLVPGPGSPPLNPIVVAALRRIERARQPSPAPARTRATKSGSAAAAAVARVEAPRSQKADSGPKPAPADLPSTATPNTAHARRAEPGKPAPTDLPPTATASQQREMAMERTEVREMPPAEASSNDRPAMRNERPHGLIVVPAQPASIGKERETPSAHPGSAPARFSQPGSAGKEREAGPAEPPVVKAEPAIQAKAEPAPQARDQALQINAPQPAPRRVIDEVVDDAMLSRREAEMAAQAAAAQSVDIYNDRAPLSRRLVANIIDLALIAFVSSPFAAIIELTHSNWADWRVIVTMIGIVLAIAFLYNAAAITLAGYTWGMSLVALRVVDAETGLAPSAKQAAGRAALYLLSLLTLGLGFLCAFLGIEGRTAHDLFSGTIVVRQ